MKTFRVLNKKELDYLQRELQRNKKQFISYVKFISGWILLSLIIGVIAFLNIDNKLRVYLYAAIGIYIAIGLRVFFQQTRQLNKATKRFEFVEQQNQITSIVVRSTSYIQLSETEDEGVFYLFQLDADNILSFGGQEFYPSKNFPSSDFEIAIAYGPIGEIVTARKYVSGEKLQPMLLLKGEEKWNLLSKASYPDPEKFTIIPGRLENYKALIV